MSSEIMKCKYAGDQSDDYCASCNGVTMTTDGKETSCSECAGYEPSDEETTVVEDVVEDEVVETTEESADVVDDIEETEVEEVVEEAPKKRGRPKKTEKTEKKVVTTTEPTNNSIMLEGIVCKSIKYTCSATMKVGDSYIKASAEEEWDLTAFKGDPQDAREALWETLRKQVNTQISEHFKK